MQVVVTDSTGLHHWVQSPEPEARTIEHSLAISLKRIADALTFQSEKPYNLYDFLKHMSDHHGE